MQDWDFGTNRKVVDDNSLTDYCCAKSNHLIKELIQDFREHTRKNHCRETSSPEYWVDLFQNWELDLLKDYCSS